MLSQVESKMIYLRLTPRVDRVVSDASAAEGKTNLKLTSEYCQMHEKLLTAREQLYLQLLAHDTRLPHIYDKLPQAIKTFLNETIDDITFGL